MTDLRNNYGHFIRCHSSKTEEPQVSQRHLIRGFKGRKGRKFTYALQEGEGKGEEGRGGEGRGRKEREGKGREEKGRVICNSERGLSSDTGSAAS